MKNLSAFIIASALSVSAMAQSQRPALTEPRNADGTPVAQDKRTGLSGKIKGRVVADGHAVAEAMISVFPVNITGNMESFVTSIFRPVSVDADGRFEVTGLRAGVYTISASSPGYVLSDENLKTFYRPGDNTTLTLVKGGVITGRVTNSSGDPVVGALVRAIKIREPDDKPARAPGGGMFSQITEALNAMLGPYKTDDRGVYRIYGLAPGIYQVAAGGRGAMGFTLGGSNPYDGDAPTYYPSSTLETAGDVTVAAGGEATGIDIRYRSNRGYSISGTVTGSGGAMPQGTSVLLARASSGMVEATSTALPARDQNKFFFESLLDGEYVVTAMSANQSSMALSPDGISASISQPRRVTVKGADVTGIELTLEPLASIAGRVVLEPLQDAKQKAECKNLRTPPLEEVVLSARDQNKQDLVDPMTFNTLSSFMKTTPSDRGEFVLSLLRPGVQRVQVELPGEHLYLKSMILPHADPKSKPIDVAKAGVTLKSGDKVKGLVLTFSEGAPGLRGKIVVGEKNSEPTSKMRVHVVPAEPEAVDEVLRYYEAEAAADGSFSFNNLAPGKYWLVAREVSDQEQKETDHRPLAWDAGSRTALRFEGEATKKVVELTTCQRMTDYVLKYTPLIPPKSPLKKQDI